MLKTFIVVVLFVVAAYVLLAMLSVLKQNKDNPEEFRKRYQENLDAIYARHGGFIGYHLVVAEWTKRICIVIITLCTLSFLF